MAVFKPINKALEALVGQTLYAEWDFFSDDEHTIVFDLTGYTLEVVITPPGFDDTATPLTLTDGSGLSLNLPGGVVQLEQDTSAWVTGRGHWYLRATDPSGLVSFPLRGVLNVGTP